MRQFAVLIFCGFLFASCSKVKKASNENAQTIPTPTALVSLTVETSLPLKPVVPNVKLIESKSVELK